MEIILFWNDFIRACSWNVGMVESSTAYSFFFYNVYIWCVMFKRFDGLRQDCSISIAYALEILQSSTKPAICLCLQHTDITSGFHMTDPEKQTSMLEKNVMITVLLKIPPAYLWCIFKYISNDLHGGLRREDVCITHHKFFQNVILNGTSQLRLLRSLEWENGKLLIMNCILKEIIKNVLILS